MVAVGVFGVGETVMLGNVDLFWPLQVRRVVVRARIVMLRARVRRVRI